MRHVACQRLGNSGLHWLGAIAIQQLGQPGRDRPQVVAASSGALEQFSHRGHGLRESVGGAVLARCALVVHQILNVIWQLDLRATVVASRVVGQHRGTRQDAHAISIGDHREGAPDMGVRNRIVIQVEARIGRLAHLHVQTFAHRILVLGQCQQAAAFALKCLAHGKAIILGPQAIGGLSITPGTRLGVQIIHVGEAACGEEVVADIADRPLDATLLVSTRHGHRARLEAVVRGEGQQFGIEADGVAHALEHGALKIVVEQDPSHSVPCAKGQHMAAQEAVHAGVQTEVQEDAP